MRLEFNGRHGDDMLSLLEPIELRLFHLLLRSHILDMDDLGYRRQLQCLGYLLHHVLRRAEDQDAMRLLRLYGSPHFLSMPRQDEDCPAHSHDLALLFLR